MTTQNLFSDQEVKDIIDKDIFELLAAKDMAQEKKQELYQKMAETVQNRVIARIDDALSEPDRQEWLKILDEQNKEKAEAFLRERNLDAPKMLIEEALIYKMELVNLSKSAQAVKE